MARGGFTRGARGIPAPKRQIANFGLTAEIDGLTTVVGIAKAVYTFGTQLANTDAATLVRTRGMLGVRAAAVAGAANIVRGVFGIIVVSDDAAGIGVTAVPGPLTDSENDWVVWQPFTLLFDATIPSDSPKAVNVAFDSRGMRKMKSGDVLTTVLEVESDIAGSAIDSAISWRQQFKL